MTRRREDAEVKREHSLTSIVGTDAEYCQLITLPSIRGDACGWLGIPAVWNWNPTKRETHNFHPLQIRENIGSSLLANQRGT